MNSFSNKKKLEFVIRLNKGAKFQASDTDTVILKGYRAAVDVVNAGAYMMGQCKARIYGVSQSIMNDVTTMQWQAQTLRNGQIEIYAIDGETRSLVFRGDIKNAWGDYGSPPDVYLNIEASVDYDFQITPVQPTSFKGVWKLKDVFQWYATKMSLVLEYDAGDGQIENGYYADTLLNQVRKIVQDYNLSLTIEGYTLVITKKGFARTKIEKCVVSKETGLIGYPMFDSISITCKSLFNPNIRHNGLIEVKTDIATPLFRTNGEWTVASISHSLESEKIGGAWFSTFRANYNGIIK